VIRVWTSTALQFQDAATRNRIPVTGEASAELDSWFVTWKWEIRDRITTFSPWIFQGFPIIIAFHGKLGK
jgi:hypothetical protein